MKIPQKSQSSLPMDERVYCCEIEDTGKPQCCTSCHDDREAGYDGYECALPDGRYFIGCCTVGEWLLKRFDSAPRCKL